jgi:AraC-like DNA-binding protein/CheY-like chemotaxis protein
MRGRAGILNVDDNEVARYVKRRILVQAGFDVIDASCGAEALAALAAEKVDLALVDMKLPDMSGFEVTRRIRAMPGGDALPVVQISAVCVTSDDQRDGLDSGADAYLVVPFEAEQLVALVREIIAAGRDSPPRMGDALSQARVRRIDAFIRAHIGEPITLEALAAVVELSPFYFTRMFRAATGHTPLDYVMEVRVEEAERLLGTTRLALADIAQRVGFRTQAHFSTVFRRRRGCTPRTLRAAAAKKKTARA